MTTETTAQPLLSANQTISRDSLIEFEPATFIRADDIAAIRPIILAVVDPQNRHQSSRRIQIEVVLRSGVAVRLQEIHNTVEEARETTLRAIRG